MRSVIAELARDAAVRFGEDVAIVFPGDRSLSFAEADALRRALTADAGSATI